MHFRLHNPIMVGKKKTDDVQFYTEVGEAVQTLDGGRRSMYDPDEIEEEQRERDVRNKVCSPQLCGHLWVPREQFSWISFRDRHKGGAAFGCGICFGMPWIAQNVPGLIASV